MKSIIRNGTIVTMNKTREVFVGDILVEDGKISKVSKSLPLIDKGLEVIDATGCFVIPGLIQTHTHLCQVLFRGLADDMSLLTWLKKKIWPLEHAHSAKSLRMSALLGILEMMRCGTTSILDMGTIEHTQTLLEAVQETGIRYWGGKCLMDAKGRSGPLYEDRKEALRETQNLMHEWTGRTELIEYALCPRFAVSCTDEMLRNIADLQKVHDLIVHTHASESLEEIELVKKLTKKDNIVYLDSVGLLNSRSVIVHGVHMSDKELSLMTKKKAKLTHCPSSNLKLASGVAPIEKYRKKGLVIGLGSDGAPCNNSMDPFKEMHLAALLQKPLFGPKALPAVEAFEMATLGGARVLGAEDRVGSLEVGKLADIVVVDRSHPSVCTVQDPYSALVYSCNGRDVKHVMINGQVVVKDLEAKTIDGGFVSARAKEELKALVSRAGI